MNVEELMWDRIQGRGDPMLNPIFPPETQEPQRGRLNVLGGELPTALTRSITVEDLQYDKPQTPNQWQGTARITIDVLGPRDDVSDAIRAILRRLSYWTIVKPDGDRIISIRADESTVMHTDTQLQALGTCRFLVSFIET